MSAPKFDLCQWTYQNPDASSALNIPLIVLCNTPDEEIEANVRANTALDLPWLGGQDAHDGVAVMVGGGASVVDHIEDIRRLASQGATIFAMNAASQYLGQHGIATDWQVTCDAKAETANLINPAARGHLFASHVHADTINAAPSVTLWHSALHANEDWFPPAKKKRGGYAILGGEASTGLGALCVAYCLGFRRLEIFGYDSCHRGDQSHAYEQRMNGVIPVMSYSWAGRSFQTSVTMRTQAERFPIIAQALQQSGASVNVWGDGLLQHIWTAPSENLTERDKYSRIWQIEEYRALSPGEVVASAFLEVMAVSAGSSVIDFGCGTGRGGLALAAAGLDVTLTDFISASRDQEALVLPFLEWDLTQPCPLRAPYGFCCDVMEHIPPDDVEKVLNNITVSADTVFFQISTVPDIFGAMIGQTLHLSVKPHEWWLDIFASIGLQMLYAHQGDAASIFVVRRTLQ